MMSEYIPAQSLVLIFNLSSIFTQMKTSEFVLNNCFQDSLKSLKEKILPIPFLHTMYNFKSYLSFFFELKVLNALALPQLHFSASSSALLNPLNPFWEGSPRSGDIISQYCFINTSHFEDLLWNYFWKQPKSFSQYGSLRCFNWSKHNIMETYLLAHSVLMSADAEVKGKEEIVNFSLYASNASRLAS